jgi:hypothetical protein
MPHLLLEQRVLQRARTILGILFVSLFFTQETDAFVIHRVYDYHATIAAQKCHARRIPPLGMVVGKTGGSVIESPEQYALAVLEPSDDDKPVLVFWTAPWWYELLCVVDCFCWQTYFFADRMALALTKWPFQYI